MDRHWVLKLIIYSELNHHFFKIWFHHHTISPIFAKKITFGTNCELLQQNSFESCWLFMTSRCPWVPNIPTHFVPLDNEDLLQPHFSQLCSVLFSSQFSSEKTIATLSPTSLPTGPVREIVSDAAFLEDLEEVGKVLVDDNYWFWLLFFLLKHDGDNNDCDEDENKRLNSGCSCQEKYFLHNAVDLQPWRRKGGEINMRKQSTSYTTARIIYIFI